MAGFQTASLCDQKEFQSKVCDVSLNWGKSPCPGRKNNGKNCLLVSAEMKHVWSSKTHQRTGWCPSPMISFDLD